MYLGIYNDRSLMQRIVDEISQLDVDALMIAGDFTYEAKRDELEELFEPLGRLKIPIYAVLGNHDCQRLGSDIRDRLEKVLESYGVEVITNRSVKLNGITILGLGSHWARDDKVSLLDRYSDREDLIVSTHNPDTVLDYESDHHPDLTLSGHIHGGEVRISYIYKRVIPVKGVVLWDKGLMSYRGNQVFITSGIGSIGLPLRFLIPPTIDILRLY